MNKKEENKKKTIREVDEHRSKIASEFLDEKFFKDKENFERIYNFKEQIEGIDVKFSLGDTYYLCDEKASVRHYNREKGPLDTFSMELSLIDRGNHLHDGWLVDKTKTNNSFLFIWIDKVDGDEINTIDNIEELEIALVRKENIIGFLESKGLTVDKLIEESTRIRKEHTIGFGKYYFEGDLKNNGYEYCLSRSLREKPINILIHREKLKEMSDFHYFYKK